MPRKPQYKRSFEVLNAHAHTFGVVRLVDSPVTLLQQVAGISYQTALRHLKELDARKVIAVERDSQDGKVIASARVLKDKIDTQLHEQGSLERLVRVLRKYKTRSQHNTHWIVHSGFFSRVYGDADIGQAQFYTLLRKLEKRGWIEIKKDEFAMREKILFVTLNDSFPLQCG